MLDTLIPALLYFTTTIILLCMIVYVMGFLKGMEHEINKTIKHIHDDKE